MKTGRQAADVPTAVSYTHLDVYKRQEQIMLPANNIISSKVYFNEKYRPIRRIVLFLAVRVGVMVWKDEVEWESFRCGVADKMLKLCRV